MTCKFLELLQIGENLYPVYFLYELSDLEEHFRLAFGSEYIKLFFSSTARIVTASNTRGQDHITVQHLTLHLYVGKLINQPRSGQNIPDLTAAT